jgi:hypothetical protein
MPCCGKLWREIRMDEKIGNHNILNFSIFSFVIYLFLLLLFFVVAGGGDVEDWN